jgi:hypothetical protein
LEEEIEDGRKYVQDTVDRYQCFGGACCIQLRLETVGSMSQDKRSPIIFRNIFNETFLVDTEIL